MGGKAKKWWRYLLWIPGVLVLDVLLLVGAALLDVSLLPAEPSGQGHGFPVVSLLASFILFGVTGLVLVWSVYKATRSFLQQG